MARDLGLTWDEYLEAGRQAEQAAEIDERLEGSPGYQGVALDDGAVVISGTGPAVTRAAQSESVETEQPAQTLDEDRIFDLYAQEVDAERRGLLGVTWDGSGWSITVEDADLRGTLVDGRPGVTPRQFADGHPGTSLKVGSVATTHADILGGQGWGSFSVMPRCSIGFAAFGPDGRQAMVTAGHCSDGGTISDARWEDNDTVSLGRLAFYQFGSVQNTANTMADVGTDLAAYSGSPASLRAAMASYPGTVKITGSTAPVVGAPVCTSGRTTKRWVCSVIDAVGPYAVQGPGGRADIRWAQGFSTPLLTRPGDSGAGMVTGLKAVGIVSAGGVYDGLDYSFGASLDPVLSRGYSLEIWLNAPRAEPVANGRVRGQVSAEGTIPAGTSVRIESGTQVITAPVDANGRFDASAPAGQGRIMVVNGNSRSDVMDYDPRYGSSLGSRFCGLKNGGCYQTFTSGSVYWTPSTGEHLVKGRIFSRWGETRWENGWLGYPTSSEMCGLVGRGCWQTFQGGRMYWSPATDAFGVRGAIGQEWNGTGYEHGTLGYPTSIEFCGLRNGGCFQRFQEGSIYWSPASGANWIRGAIRTEWGRRGWENGYLGYPLSGEICGLNGGGCYQQMQGGALYWSARTGAHPVTGAIRQHWTANGSERGRFGYPTSGESCQTVAGTRTCTQRFVGGTISWTLNGGARG